MSLYVSAANAEAGMAALVLASIALVMSATNPASAIAASLPPPRCRKMSGALPPLSAVCSLPSRSSFCTGWRLMVTFGCTFLYAAMVSAQNCGPLPVVLFSHSVSVAV